MIALVADKLKEIEALCRKYRIARLDLFGSAATGTFDPATSDLDFLVDLGDFLPEAPWRVVDLGLDLESLLGRPAHLTTMTSLRNPYFVTSVTRGREKLYDARDREAAA